MSQRLSFPPIGGDEAINDLEAALGPRPRYCVVVGQCGTCGRRLVTPRDRKAQLCAACRLVAAGREPRS